MALVVSIGGQAVTVRPSIGGQLAPVNVVTYQFGDLSASASVLAAVATAEAASEAAVGGQVKTVSATTYTVLDADNRYNLRFTAATAVTVTVPSGLTHHFICSLRQAGLGQVTVSAGSGVTIANADSAYTTETQGVSLSLESSASDVYDLDGRTV